ncbi:MAG: hypothetical protein PVJ02_16725 [Gemmatimonadota bacterium]|jgi:hypothetical protein
MKTPHLDLGLGGRRWALIAVGAVLNLCGCSDSPTAPADTGSSSLMVTITGSSVSAGALVRLTFSPTRPCWNQDAEMDVVLSWDAARFAWVDTPDVGVEERGGGRIRVRGMDRDGFGSGMTLAFRALADGSTAGFVVHEVLLRCERGTMVEFRDPPLLAAPSS